MASARMRSLGPMCSRFLRQSAPRRLSAAVAEVEHRQLAAVGGGQGPGGGQVGQQGGGAGFLGGGGGGLGGGGIGHRHGVERQAGTSGVELQLAFLQGHGQCVGGRAAGVAQRRTLEPAAAQARVVGGHQQHRLEGGGLAARAGDQQQRGLQGVPQALRGRAHSTTTTLCGTRPTFTVLVALALATSTMLRSSRQAVDHVERLLGLVQRHAPGALADQHQVGGLAAGHVDEGHMVGLAQADEGALAVAAHGDAHRRDVGRRARPSP